MDTILNYKEEDLDLGLDEGVNDPGIFKAVILAGGPGSGKSYVAKKMGLKSLGLIVVNSDLSNRYPASNHNTSLGTKILLKVKDLQRG